MKDKKKQKEEKGDYYTCDQCKKKTGQVYLVGRNWLCEKCWEKEEEDNQIIDD
jgi:ribosomal protein L37AE/L43A